MGSVGFAMPLLSTLAALVIIVNSAEEDYEREYRVLRPRALDVDTLNYDQPWRMVELEPMMTQSSQITHSDTWDDDGPEQAVRRRRPVRKRKRRPHLSVEDDLKPQDRYVYNQESQSYLQENIDRPRRRRKKIENQGSDEDNRQSGWNEEIENRPKRRRGQKRKKPLGGSWPELSEFGGYRQERIDGSAETTDNKEILIDSTLEDGETDSKDINDKIDSKVQIYSKDEPDSETTIATMIDYGNQSQMVQKDADRSLSEFSIESMRPNEKPNVRIVTRKEKIEDKTIVLSNNIAQAKENEPLDPFTLKSLLKRSNGKSLSEILQQNNLSLADLLNGREKALSILKKEGLPRSQDIGQTKNLNTFYYNPVSSTENVKVLTDIDTRIKKGNESIDVETTTTFITTTEYVNLNYKENNAQEEFVKSDHSQNNEMVENHRRDYLRRRFPGGIRRKLRTRPTSNNTFKNQLSRDLIALTSIKYKNNRNFSKSKEWKEIMPSIVKTESSNVESNIKTEVESAAITTAPCTLIESTTQEIYETTTDPSDASMNTEPNVDFKQQDGQTYDAESKKYFETESTDTAQSVTTTEIEITTDKPKHLPDTKPLTNASDLRRQAFSNRLKRKRLKQRTSTTEIPEEFIMKDSVGIGKFVSAPDSITKTQTGITNVENYDFTTLEDFLTTESTQRVFSRYRSKKPLTNKITTFAIQREFVTTEETAKFEIEEILNDTHTSARLSKILKERNMTLEELVEHRERGSSHVHLADIFHNASKEPNPPEPFLSKSLIEPISKETYPLRALLEANLHDPRTTTIDPNVPQMSNVNIPVVMDFGNNVNENGENMGIISLFNNYSKTNTHKIKLNNESASIIFDPADDNSIQRTTREGLTLNSEKDSVMWNDFINAMPKTQQKENIAVNKMLSRDIPISETLQKIDLDEDVDGDGLILLDDLRQLRNFESKTSDELSSMKLYETNKSIKTPTMSDTKSSSVRSVTVATASIIGLALVLFLLTYAFFKWKQQSKIFQSKHAKEDEFVPTPVFESRKSHKINSSTRSKSPMLASSSIYAIETIDTHVGSESPEYMWNTLRKPY